MTARATEGIADGAGSRRSGDDARGSPKAALSSGASGEFSHFFKSLKRFDPGLVAPDIGSAVSNVRQISSDTLIWSDPDESQPVYLLLDGVAFTFTHLMGGRRHIEDVFGPGSLCNGARLSDRDHKLNIHFKRDAKIAVLDPRKFNDVLEANPAFAAALAHAEKMRAKRLWQRVRTLISLPGSHRVTVFLLDLIEEFCIPYEPSIWVPFSLTQEEMADLLGLTEVHVNRVLARMEQAGEIERKRGRFRLCDADRLIDRLHYENTCPGNRE